MRKWYICYNVFWSVALCRMSTRCQYFSQFGTYTSISPHLMLTRVVTVEFLKINLINQHFEMNLRLLSILTSVSFKECFFMYIYSYKLQKTAIYF